MSGVCAFAVAVEQTSTATARRPRTNDPPFSRIFILITSNRVSKNPVHSTLLLTLLQLSRQINDSLSRPLGALFHLFHALSDIFRRTAGREQHPIADLPG